MNVFSGECKFCEGGNPLAIGEVNHQGIMIKRPNILTAFGYENSDDYEITVKINYCPMCGRKLEEHK